MRRASLDSVPAGTALAKPILNERGQMLLTAGTPLTDRYIRTLLDRGTNAITVEDPDTEGIEVQDVISDALRATATNTVYKVYEAIETAGGHLKGRSPAEIQAGIRSGEFKRTAGHLVPTAQLVSVVDEIMNEVMDVDLLTGMAAIKSYDNYTFAHSVEMATAAIVVGRKLRLERGSLRRLARACLLHDIGKIFIADEILNKQGKLNPEEQEQMRLHPLYGFELLQAVQPDDVLINNVALQHHERQDGQGYPQGLTGTNKVERPKFGNNRRILLIAEIASIADVYDALASKRPYREALAPETVVDIMTGMSGTALNAELLEVFLSTVPTFPVGMTVMVVDGKHVGCQGVVARINQRQLGRPVVRVIRDGKGQRVTPFEIDLSQERGTRIESVL